MSAKITHIYTLLIALLLTAGSAWSQTTFTHEDIPYEVIDDTTVQVGRVYRFALSGDVTIPATVTRGAKKYDVTAIRSEAFSGCDLITGIDIPISVTTIGNAAFSICSELKSITIPAGVTTIGYRTFAGCTNLKSVTIPASVTSIEGLAFHGCNSLTDIVIPAGVTSIEDGAFLYCHSLTGITIPDGVPSIGHQTFAYCSNLTNIDIPASVASIGDGAFFGCDSLTSITIPDGVPSIGHQTFSYCASLTEIDIPAGVTSIGRKAFYNCEALTSIVIPASVISIESDALYGCWRLASITVAADNPNYKDIDGVLFSKDGTRLVIYPAGKSDNSYTIPAGVTSISEYAFGNCRELISIAIPAGVTSIGSRAFFGCSRLTSITIPDGVISIEYETFTYCVSLTNVDLPASVTSIRHGAFENCEALTDITIPAGVKSIGSDAFSFCRSLTGITLQSATPPTFGDQTSNPPVTGIYVPFEAKDAYIAAPAWSTYASLIKGISTITFNSQGGTPVNTQSIKEDARPLTVAIPTAPTREGYKFGGWYKEAACTNRWKFSTKVVSQNVTLYAKWTPLRQQKSIDITHLLSFEQFENIKKFVLNQGQTMTYCNKYNNNPYYKFGNIELFLNPIVQFPHPSSISDPDTYNVIMLKMWNAPQDYQFRYTDITAYKETKKVYLSPYGKEAKKSMQLRYRTIGKYLTEIISEIQKVENDESNSAESFDKSIEGRYRNSEETTCELLLDIIKSGDEYSYKLRVKDRLYEGAISISIVDDEKWVTLESIPWMENIGPINDDDAGENIPTYGIDLYWADYEMGLQNYGNAMNYYVKLDCDDKFIRFVKD